MSAFSTDSSFVSTEDAAGMDLLNKNMLTTAGVLVAGSTALAGGALLTAALPAQMLAAAGTSAALIYAGDRKSKDLPILPWSAAPTAPLMSDDYDHTAGVDVEAAA